MTHIRTACIDDIPIIQDIAYKTWPLAFKEILEPKQIDYMLEMMYSTSSLSEQISSKGHTFILSFIYISKKTEKDSYNSECRYTGYSSYEINVAGSLKTKIHKLYVLPKYQGRGCGKEMLKEVQKIARSNNSEVLSLNVNRNNRAVDFYKSFGFKVVIEEDINIGNGFLMEDFVMEKVL